MRCANNCRRCEWRRERAERCKWKPWLRYSYSDFLYFFHFSPLVIDKVVTANCQPIVFWAKVETRERVWSCIYCRIDCTGEEATLLGARFLESWNHLFTHLPVPIRQYSVRARGQALESDEGLISLQWIISCCVTLGTFTSQTFNFLISKTDLRKRDFSLGFYKDSLR